jgi:hypothetical protein
MTLVLFKRNKNLFLLLAIRLAVGRNRKTKRSCDP